MPYTKPRYDYTASLIKVIRDIGINTGKIEADNIDLIIVKNEDEVLSKKWQSALKLGYTPLCFQEKQLKTLEQIDPKLSAKEMKTFHSALLKGQDVPIIGSMRKEDKTKLRNPNYYHIAPPANLLKKHIKNLLKYGTYDEDLGLIKGFATMMELIYLHPFEFGTTTLSSVFVNQIIQEDSPLYKLINWEKKVVEQIEEFRQQMQQAFASRNNTDAIVFLLNCFQSALEELVENIISVTPTAEERLQKAKQIMGPKTFSRKDYMIVHHGISYATASRDLRLGVEKKSLKKTGLRSLTEYVFK